MQAELSLIVVDAANTPILLDLLGTLPQVKYVLKAGEITADEKEAAKATGATIMSFGYAGPVSLALVCTRMDRRSAEVHWRSFRCYESSCALQRSVNNFCCQASQRPYSNLFACDVTAMSS